MDIGKFATQFLEKTFGTKNNTNWLNIGLTGVAAIAGGLLLGPWGALILPIATMALSGGVNGAFNGVFGDGAGNGTEQTFKQVTSTPVTVKIPVKAVDGSTKEEDMHMLSPIMEKFAQDASAIPLQDANQKLQEFNIKVSTYNQLQYERALEKLRQTINPSMEAFHHVHLLLEDGKAWKEPNAAGQSQHDKLFTAVNSHGGLSDAEIEDFLPNLPELKDASAKTRYEQFTHPSGNYAKLLEYGMEAYTNLVENDDELVEPLHDAQGKKLDWNKLTQVQQFIFTEQYALRYLNQHKDLVDGSGNPIITQEMRDDQHEGIKNLLNTAKKEHYENDIGAMNSRTNYEAVINNESGTFSGYEDQYNAAIIFLAENHSWKELKDFTSKAKAYQKQFTSGWTNDEFKTAYSKIDTFCDKPLLDAYEIIQKTRDVRKEIFAPLAQDFRVLTSSTIPQAHTKAESFAKRMEILVSDNLAIFGHGKTPEHDSHYIEVKNKSNPEDAIITLYVKEKDGKYVITHAHEGTYQERKSASWSSAEIDNIDVNKEFFDNLVTLGGKDSCAFISNLTSKINAVRAQNTFDTTTGLPQAHAHAMATPQEQDNTLANVFAKVLEVHGSQPKLPVKDVPDEEALENKTTSPTMVVKNGDKTNTIDMRGGTA